MIPAHPEPRVGEQALSDYIDAFQKLRDIPARQLVEFAMEHVAYVLPPLQRLVLEELCTRVDPEWANREPESVDLRAFVDD